VTAGSQKRRLEREDHYIRHGAPIPLSLKHDRSLERERDSDRQPCFAEFGALTHIAIVTHWVPSSKSRSNPKRIAALVSFSRQPALIGAALYGAGHSAIDRHRGRASGVFALRGISYFGGRCADGLRRSLGALVRF
jgi:hypothetical protein